jgi:uncharacterized protein YkwD
MVWCLAIDFGGSEFWLRSCCLGTHISQAFAWPKHLFILKNVVLNPQILEGKSFMSLNARRFVVPGLCLALILLLAPGLEAQWRGEARTERVSYVYNLERQIFRLTNEVRRRHGIPQLTWETSLEKVARTHSADMLRRNYFSHLTPEGQSPHERISASYPFPLSMTGENIWSGTGHDASNTSRLARLIVNNWMSSAGHRENLLNPKFTDIGVGAAAQGRDIRVTQVFVRTREAR